MINRVDPDILKRLKDIFSADNPVDLDVYRQKLDALKDDVSSGLYPIHMALKAGDPDLLQKLIDLDEDINEENADGEIPLNLAASSNNAALLDVVLKSGAKLNIDKAVGVDRLTPLHMLAKENTPDSINLMRELLKAGAKVNVVDELGKTPLHYAATSKNRDVINLLMGEGASLDIQDKEGLTPFKDERRVEDLHAGQRVLSAATIDFEKVLRAFISGNPPATQVNRLGEIEVELDGRKYNLSKILEHKPDFEHINLTANLSKEALDLREAAATNFFRDMTTYRLNLDSTVPEADRKNMIIYEVNNVVHECSAKGELQVEAYAEGLLCVNFGKADTLIPWSELPGVPQDFTDVKDIGMHLDKIISVLNKIDTSIIPESEARAIRYYTMSHNSDNAFSKINRFLRQNGMIDDLTQPGGPDLRAMMYTIAYLPQAIIHLREHNFNVFAEQNEKAGILIPPPVQELHRGETYDTKSVADSIFEQRTAKTFAPGTGFVSTSSTKEVIEDFVNPNDEKTNVSAQYSHQENTFGVDISKYSDGAHENEVLLMPGMQIIFRRSPYADNALVATPVRTIDEIYSNAYHPNIMDIRGAIIKLVDDYAKTKDRNEPLIWAMDEFCRDFGKYEAGALYNNLVACNKCIDALDNMSPQVKLTEEYQAIRSKVMIASQAVNEAINIAIDVHYNNRESPELSTFIQAAKYAFDNHLSKGFTDLHICADDPFQELNGSLIVRPNHGLAHSIRTALYIPAICSTLKSHANSDEYRAFTSRLDQTDIHLIQLAMIFYVSGRRSEASWMDSPEAVKSYRQAAGENFHNYIAQHKSEFRESKEDLIQLLENILSNANFKQEAGPYGLFMLNVIDMSHRLDLLRCYPKEEYEDAIMQSCDMMKNDVDSSFKEKALPVLLKVANDSVAANGDRRLTIFQGGKLTEGNEDTMAYRESFIAASTNPEACIKQCLSSNPTYFEIQDGKLNIDLQQKKIKLTPLQNAVLCYDDAEVKRILASPEFDNKLYHSLIGKVIDLLSKPDLGQLNILIAEIKNAKNLNPGDLTVALHIALDKKQEELALALIEKGADLTFTNARGETPLFVAAKRDLAPSINAIMNKSNTTNIQDEVGHAPILAAATRKSWNAVLELLKSPNIDLTDLTGNSVLSLAILNNREDVALALLAHKSSIDVNMCYEPHRSPLYYAIDKNMEDVASALMKRGAATNSDSIDSDNYLDFAVSKKAWGIVLQMAKLPSVDVNTDLFSGNSLLVTAISNKKHDIVQALLDRNVICTDENDLRNPVLFAIGQKSPFAKQLITAMMADKVQPAPVGLKWKVMVAAIQSKDTELMKHAFEEIYVKQDINKINDVNHKTGHTLLTLACSYGHMEFLKVLLPYNPELNTAGHYGTPLSIAVSHGREDVVELLVKHGVNINQRNKGGESLLTQAAAAEEWDVVKYLLTVPGILIDNDDKRRESFLKVFATSFRGPKEIFVELLNDNKHDISPETLTAVLCALSSYTHNREITLSDVLNSNRTFDINKHDNEGVAPMHHAAITGNVDAMMLLLKHGGDINVLSADVAGEKTPLRYAIDARQWKIINEMLDIPGISLNGIADRLLQSACAHGQKEIVEKILNIAAKETTVLNIDAINYKGETSLALAVEGEHAGIVELLLKHNANVNIRNGDDVYYPIELAAAKSTWPVVELILDVQKLNEKAEPPIFSISEVFYHAVRDENYEIAKRLMARDDFKLGYATLHGNTAISQLIYADQYELANELLKRTDIPGMEKEVNGNADGDSLVCLAGESHHWDTVLYLLDHNVELDYDDVSTMKLLGQACEENRTDIVEAIFKKMPPDPIFLNEVIDVLCVHTDFHELVTLAEYMLTHGYNPDQKNSYGDTCLHIAVANQRVELVSLLLKHGASLNSTNDKSQKPIDLLPAKENITSATQREQREKILSLISPPARTLSSSHSTLFGSHQKKAPVEPPKSTPSKGFDK